MKKKIILLVSLFALFMGGWTWDDRGAAHAGRYLPGDQGGGCTTGTQWHTPDGHLHSCVGGTDYDFGIFP